MELRKFVGPEFVYGENALDLVARYAVNFGAQRPLIVTDPGVVKAGWTKQVCDALVAVSLPPVVFDGVSSNPRDCEISAGVERYRSEDCDVIIAVGGGSPMDCAKGIGISHSNDKPITAFEGVDQVDIPGPPLICIPTTAGTSADVSQFAIVNDTARKVKIAIISKTVVPDVALIDPITTTTMDSYLSACTGMDALVHAIEAFVSSAHSPITDLHALEAVRIIVDALPRVIESPDDIGLRSRMMLASLHAGLAFSNASLGAVHAMAHSLGGLLDMPHGECNSLLLAPVMAFNYSKAADRYDTIGEAMGLDLKGIGNAERQRMLIERIDALREAVGIRGGLSQRGVNRHDIAELARKALQDPCMATNPRIPDLRDIEVIYEECL
ncbi:alcohol dehydrogenase-like regulatory protein ErcA [Desulfatirhabdium butyrativorans]|uniref:alcohol dehydrogenase-like regulatory protein ErcA n=1 Tax=Desulfatirhabdium butyrativorans TaxID=340467 RepID=UPI0003F4B219|nr:alcohol dehydrogenase-like regulatory protein ErcA [Desulfatirhabdium butyrativorans]